MLLIAHSGCKSGKTFGPDGAAPALPAGGRYELIERSVPVLPGRPLLVALRWTGDPAAAPANVDARTDAGLTITLPVRRLGTRPHQPRPESALRFTQWRWSAPALEIFEIDPSSHEPAAAHLLVLNDPDSWPGVGLNVGADRAVLVPVEADPDEPSSAERPGTGGFDEPHATSPLDAVRRGLWRRHVNPSAPAAAQDDQSTLSMLGRQTAGRWFAALRDLTLIDPALSLELQRLLVRTAWDGSTRFAAWPPWTADLSELESILFSRLTQSPGDEDWRLRVKAWMARQPDAVPWIEVDAGNEVRLPCANLTTSSQRATMSYANRPGVLNHLELPPTSVGRVLLARPTESNPDRIIVQTATTNRTLALLNPESVVLPPGLGFEVLWRSWTLDTWLAGQPASADDKRLASLLVRRSPTTQQWELIVTCRLVQPLPAAAPGATRPIEAVADWSELIGCESVTLLLGPFGEPIVAATILPDGSMRDWRRSGLLTPAAVKVEPGRWQATIALPEGILFNSHLDLGLIRMHEGTDEVDCFPRPALPWRPDPGRMRLDLSRWDALPSPPPAPQPESSPGE